MAKVTLDIILDSKGNVRAVQQAGSELQGLGKSSEKTASSMDKLKKVAGMVGGALAALKTAQVAVDFVKLGAQVEATEHRFTQFAGGAEQAEQYLQSFQSATDNTVSRMESMQGAAKLLQMGLVENADEMARVAGIATKLGDQTMGAGDRIADFAALLANQSIPRLDNFGISSGRVRTRIDELLKSGQALNREQAFKMAVMEEGAKSMAILGDTSELTNKQIAELEAAFKDAKEGVAQYAAEMIEASKATGWVAQQLRSFPDVLYTNKEAYDLLNKAAGESGKGIALSARAANMQVMAVKDAIITSRTWQEDEDELRKSLEGSRQAIIQKTEAVEIAATPTATYTGAMDQLITSEAKVSDSTWFVQSMEEREKAIKGVAQGILDMNAALFEADRQQIGRSMLNELQAAFEDPNSKLSQEEYNRAVTEIQLTFGLADAKSITLAAGIRDLASAFFDGSIGAGDVDDQLDSLVGRLSEGEEMAIASAEAMDVFRQGMAQVESATERAEDWLGTFLATLDRMPEEKVIRIRYELSNRPDDIPDFANGTMYAPGGISRINEKGGELVSLPRGARVHSAPATQRIMNQSFTFNQYGGHRSTRSDVWAMQARYGG